VERRVAGKTVFAGTGGRAWEAGLPAILMLHGAGMDHTVWALQARALAHHGRNVLALDFPGHGASEGPPFASIAALAEWVLMVADDCGLDQFRLAGHSMGSLVALEAAARADGRAEALALCGFAPEMRVHPDLMAAARAGDHIAVELMVSWSFGTQGMLGANPAPGLSTARGALRLLERADMKSLAADFAACDAYRGAAEAAAKIACPTLLLLVESDIMTPTKAALAFASKFADRRIVTLPGAGHVMPSEAPSETLAALKKIL
jgi:pimeloyl-ACP methyl ester carboxylesterase